MALSGRTIKLPKPPPRRRLHALIAVVVSVVLAWGGALVYKELGECAEGVTRTDGGECVGVTDGSYVFPGLKAISARIHKENQRIEKSGEDWVTVVHLESMSGGTSDRGREATSEVVVGAHLAQLALNGERDILPRVRLLLANTGRDDSHAGEVVDQIIALRKEERIVAVTGIGQSNARTIQAVEDLRAAQIPTVGATVAADAMASSPPEFFRISFPARAQAAAAVGYLKEQQKKQPYHVQIVRDWKKGDEYNAALYKGFTSAAKQAGLKVDEELIPFWSGAKDTAGNALRVVADKICDESPPDAVFFAGRGREIRRFIEAAGAEGRSCPVTLLSGSSTAGVYFDISDQERGQELRDLGTRWEVSRVKVYYTAFTHPQVSAHVYGSGLRNPYTRFKHRYLSVRGGSPDALGDGQAMLGHDAVYAVGIAARLRPGDVRQGPGHRRDGPQPAGADRSRQARVRRQWGTRVRPGHRRAGRQTDGTGQTARTARGPGRRRSREVPLRQGIGALIGGSTDLAGPVEHKGGGFRW